MTGVGEPSTYGKRKTISPLGAVAPLACNVISTGPDRTGDVFDRVRNLDLQPRTPEVREPVTSGGAEGTKRAWASYRKARPKVPTC